MDYVRLGASGLRVSTICLGTMMFGGPTDAKTAGRIVGSARDAGINFIDTADQYANGESEKVVGKLIKRDRERWVLATKVAVPQGEDPNRRGVGRRWLMQEIDASLKRLGTDHVDIYYFHRDDQETPFEESIGAMADLIRAGKVRYWGVSNFRTWRIVEAVNVTKAIGAPRPIVAQPLYNAMNRTPEVELLPACAYHGLGIVPYSPLARGVLTGKYKPGAPPSKETRAGRKDRRMMQTEFREESLVIAQKIKRHAEKKGMTAGQFALLWVLNNKLIASVLAGPRTFEQWTEYLGALDHRAKFDRDDEALINTLVVTGHPSTPGFNDPEYPITGRAPRAG
jgi:aryl-alcohol dehydrogenase (NADP+)